MTDIGDKRRAFRALHASGCFVIPNPWDIGSARYLAHLGFKALASTSAGFAFSRGVADTHVGRDAVLAHLAELVEVTDLPVNADFENGFAHDPAGVAQSVRLCAATGVAGLSIEDATGDAAAPLYEMPHAVARIRAAREALDLHAPDVMLVARAECFLVGRPHVQEVIARLRAYADAGADCLYAPGLRKREDIVAVVDAVAPKPFNLLVSSPNGMSVGDIAALGVRRISLGGALARAAWGGFMRAATGIAERGSFESLADAAPHAALQKIFGA
ncbi:MAG: isocitrate lyase/phosphoenolpyruvate mutase family protein [Burkholderiales bacterium]